MPYWRKIDGLAVPPLIEYFWSDMTQIFCDGGERFPRGMEVLGTARLNDTHMRHFISDEKAKATHIPKLAITISDDGFCVFSGLSTKPRVRPKDLTEHLADCGSE